MSKNNINPKNNYENRRELKTIFSKADFDLSHEKFGLSCSELLCDYFYCNICFDTHENSLTSYDGRKYSFNGISLILDQKNYKSIRTNKILKPHNLDSSYRKGKVRENRIEREFESKIEDLKFKILRKN